MINAKLGVITCDKCGEPMKIGEDVMIINVGKIVNSNDALDFKGSYIRYACHQKCWDGFEESE